MSPSTVRNHRFQLRKRRREAKLFLAIMELLDRKEANQGYLTFNAALPVADDRVKVTDEEARKILKKHFSSEDPLVLASFPKKQKAKLVSAQPDGGTLRPGTPVLGKGCQRTSRRGL
jgi:hypothetical protein